MTALSSASVITTSTSGLSSTTNINYPQLTPINNHSIYQQQQQQQGSSSMMNSEFIHSPTLYQQSFPMLDVIKMENVNLSSRSMSDESEKSNEKALDLELKTSTRQLPTLTTIESR